MKVRQCSTAIHGQVHIGTLRFQPANRPLRRRWRQTCVRAEEEKKEGKGLFGFVTDNPSSNSSFYQDSPETSEVGAVTRRTRQKEENRLYGDWWGARATGSCSTVDELTWFIREIGDKSMDERAPPTLFLHGVPSQSYSFVPVLKDLNDRKWHAYAPDWPGFGFSEHPQPNFGFNYTEQEFHTALDNMLQDKAIARPLNVVAHGFITGQYAATWALAHPDAVAKLVLIDVPLSPQTKLPLRLKPLTVPFAGAFACQDALIAERTLEGGSPYEMSLDDADVYRLPYLESSQAGVALLQTVKQAKLQDLGQRLTVGLAKWSKPTLLLTGDSDKYIKPAEAEAVAASNPSNITAKTIEAAGHQPQEDYPQLVLQELTTFLR